MCYIYILATRVGKYYDIIVYHDYQSATIIDIEEKFSVS